MFLRSRVMRRPSLFKKQCGQGGRNGAAIPKQLASQPCHHLRDRRPIIDVTWSQAASQQLTSIIHGQVELEAKEPAHAGLATPGVSRKDAMTTDSSGVTDFQ